MSIHCNAQIGDIEENVLMPGDPLRSKYIAENFLENVKLVNTIRNMLAYTGTYKGKPITIFPSGMGIPSMGIYSYELFKFYNVQKIIRVGSCGSYSKDLDLFDTILVDKSYTESNFAYTFNNQDCHISFPDEELNKIIEETAKKINIPYKKGTSLCNECFDPYMEDLSTFISRFPKDLNITSCEMEAFSLFYIAKYLKKKAACLLTVTDSPCEKEEISAQDREKSLDNMILLALESI